MTAPAVGVALLAATHLAPGWAILVGVTAVAAAVGLDLRLVRAVLPARCVRRRRWIVRTLGAIGVLAAIGLGAIDPSAGGVAALLYLVTWSLVLVLVLVAAGLAVLDAIFWLGLHAAALRHLERGAAARDEEAGEEEQA